MTGTAIRSEDGSALILDSETGIIVRDDGDAAPCCCIQDCCETGASASTLTVLVEALELCSCVASGVSTTLYTTWDFSHFDLDGEFTATKVFGYSWPNQPFCVWHYTYPIQTARLRFGSGFEPRCSGDPGSLDREEEVVVRIEISRHVTVPNRWNVAIIIRPIPGFSYGEHIAFGTPHDCLDESGDPTGHVCAGPVVVTGKSCGESFVVVNGLECDDAADYEVFEHSEVGGFNGQITVTPNCDE